MWQRLRGHDPQSDADRDENAHTHADRDENAHTHTNGPADAHANVHCASWFEGKRQRRSGLLRRH
jgi:hypothetical protein